MVFEDITDAMMLLDAFERAYGHLTPMDAVWLLSTEHLHADRAFTQFPDLRKKYPKTSEKTR